MLRLAIIIAALLFVGSAQDFVSVVKQADGSYVPGGTASVTENINTSNGENITIYRLYNGTSLACNLSSTPIDPSKPEPNTEPLISPLLIALNDSDSDIRYRAIRALGDIKSTKAIDPLINALNDDAPKVQDSSASALQKITGMNFGNDKQKWIEWRTKSADVEEQAQPIHVDISTTSLSTYSQILKTYPAGTDTSYHTEAHVTNVTDQGWELSNITSLQFSKGDMVIQGYGAMITLDIPVTIDGKRYDAGSKLTVDKDLNWVEVSSWD